MTDVCQGCGERIVGAYSPTGRIAIGRAHVPAGGMVVVREERGESAQLRPVDA